MGNAITDDELERYQRHIVLREVGGQGQMRFRAAHVAMLGAGGLGSPALQYLAAAGVGRLTIIDDDVVALSNLQRQTLFGMADIGQPKAAAAAARLALLNPEIALYPHSVRLTEANAGSLLAGHDVLVDGSDNFQTRARLNAAAVRLGIPLVSGALGPFEGQIGVFAGHLPDMPCWACFAGAPRDIPGTSCADTGILGPVAGVIGAAQAIEVLRLIHPFGTRRIGHIWLFDAIGMAGRWVRVAKDPRCPVCSAPCSALA